jgi:hypothetical protein
MRRHVRSRRRPDARAASPVAAVAFFLALAPLVIAGCGRATDSWSGPAAQAQANATSAALPSTDKPQPTNTCPAPPTASAGPQLYWAASGARAQGQGTQPQALCGAGFQPGEKVTLSVENDQGARSATVTADDRGSFETTYTPAASCSSAGEKPIIRAQGNQGSSASVAIPSGAPVACDPA